MPGSRRCRRWGRRPARGCRRARRGWTRARRPGPTAAPAPLWSVSGATTTSSCSVAEGGVQTAGERGDPRGEDAVVVGDQDAHGEGGPFVGRRAADRRRQGRRARRDRVSAGRRGLVAYHTGRHRQPDAVPDPRPRPPTGPAPRPRPRTAARAARRAPAAPRGRPRGPHARTTPPPDQRPAETTAATGDQWVIGHGHQRAVVTEVGATLRSFTVGDRPVVDGFGPEEWSHGGRGQVLAPWPNRLGDGAYRFGDVSAQAPAERARPPQRHPRAGAVAAVADDGPGPEPGRPALRPPPVAGLPLRPPARGRVPARTGRPDGDHRRREHRGRGPPVRTRASIPT